MKKIETFVQPIPAVFGWMIPVALLVSFVLPAALRAQESEEFDQYKLRFTGSFYYSKPSGSLQGQSSEVPIDFQKDLGFKSYSTFDSKADWKFTHKNHFYITFSRLNDSHQTTLERDITFRGQTFAANLVTNSQLNTDFVSAGYQYDIIRRKRGHLGIGLQVDIFKISANISAPAQIINGVQHPAISASGSLLAPIPVAGPQFRVYLTNSPHLFVEGNFYGMYFFGYGDFVSTVGDIGYAFNTHFSLTAGYQLGSRLTVNSNSSNRIGIRMSQKGATAGLVFSF